MKRLVLIAGVVALAFSLAVPSLASATGSGVPRGIDVNVLRTPIIGPVVATGRLVNAAGRGTAGMVAAVALPNAAYNRTLAIGDTVPTPTVGWAQTRPDGSFSLQVDPARIGADYLTADGTVSLIATGWTQSTQGVWAFPAKLGARQGSTSTLQTAAVASSPAQIVIRAKDALTAEPHSARTGAAPATVCGWILWSTFKTWSIIGKTEPWGADTGWLDFSASQGMTLGFGYSYGGAYGSWSQSGTTYTTDGYGANWSPSTYYRNYQAQLVYGKFRYCGAATNQYDTWSMYGTGGFGNAYISYQYYPYGNCAPVPAGITWYRNSSSGNHFSMSGGVLTAGVLGINLSLDTNYDSSRVMYYYISTNEEVCGDNATPSSASNVNTYP